MIGLLREVASVNMELVMSNFVEFRYVHAYRKSKKLTHRATDAQTDSTKDAQIFARST